MYHRFAANLFMGAAAAAYAALSFGDELEEVIVTAERRESTVQSAPLTVSAFSEDALLERNATTIASLAEVVPNFKGSSGFAQPRVTLRGIGLDNTATAAESSIAFSQDGVYYSRPSAMFASFYDVARIEVLSGPQGTLYGRNATGGSVNIITNQPTEVFHAGMELTVGNYETVNGGGFISGPLDKDLSGRISFSLQHHSGYGQNLVTGSNIDDKDSQAVRGQLLSKITDDLTVLLKGDYYHQDDRSGGYHQFGNVGYTVTGEPVTPLAIQLGGVPASDPFDIASPLDPIAENTFYGGLLEIQYRVSDAISVKSLSAYRYSDTHNDSVDGNPLTIPPIVVVYAPEENNQYTQEFQLNMDTDTNKFVAGLYYLVDRIEGLHFVPISLAVLGGPNVLAQGVTNGGTLDTDAAAIYAQDTYSFTPRLRLTLGGRYSWERKSAQRVNEVDFSKPFSPDNGPSGPFLSDSESWPDFTPKIGIDFDLAEKVMAYASFSQGFKSGTYSFGDLGPAVKPEKVNAYESGIKSMLFDESVRLDVVGFYYDYQDLQLNRVVNTVTVLENAASAEIYGLESEFQAKAFGDRLMLYANGAWLHARFQDYTSIDPNRPGGDGVTFVDGIPAFNLKGNALPQSPDFTALLGAQF